MNGPRLLGVVIGFTGVVLMIGPVFPKGLGANFMAQAAILGAAFSYSLAGVFGRRFHVLGIRPMEAAAGQLTASSIMMMPLAAFFDRPWLLDMPGLEVWGAVAGLALFSSALAYILYFRILASSGATNVVLVTLLISVSAVLLSSSILGERLEPMHFMGMGFIALGLATIDGRLLDLLRRRVDWPGLKPGRKEINTKPDSEV